MSRNFGIDMLKRIIMEVKHMTKQEAEDWITKYINHLKNVKL